MTLTVLLGLASAVCWGGPDVWLAQATRNVGLFATLFGSLLIGLLAIAPAALFVATPDWTLKGVLLAVVAGAGSMCGYLLAFRAFRDGAVGVVAPIVACEGGFAAIFAIAAGEEVTGMVAAFLPVAVVGVVLVAMGRGGGRAAVPPAVASSLVWGGVLVLSAPVADDLGVYWGFLLIRLSAFAFVLPFALRTGAWRSWTRDPWRVLIWGLADAAAYLLFVAAAERGPVSVAAVLVAQFATVAVLVGRFQGGERLLPRQLIGVALVIVAVSGIAATGS
jgi:drug/metabolite transporter (DMT)-like permease